MRKTNDAGTVRGDARADGFTESTVRALRQSWAGAAPSPRTGPGAGWRCASTTGPPSTCPPRPDGDRPHRLAAVSGRLRHSGPRGPRRSRAAARSPWNSPIWAKRSSSCSRRPCAPTSPRGRRVVEAEGSGALGRHPPRSPACGGLSRARGYRRAAEGVVQSIARRSPRRRRQDHQPPRTKVLDRRADAPPPAASRSRPSSGSDRPRATRRAAPASPTFRVSRPPSRSRIDRAGETIARRGPEPGRSPEINAGVDSASGSAASNVRPAPAPSAARTRRSARSSTWSRLRRLATDCERQGHAPAAHGGQPRQVAPRHRDRRPAPAAPPTPPCRCVWHSAADPLRPRTWIGRRDRPGPAGRRPSRAGGPVVEVPLTWIVLTKTNRPTPAAAACSANASVASRLARRKAARRGPAPGPASRGPGRRHG